MNDREQIPSSSQSQSQSRSRSRSRSDRIAELLDSRYRIPGTGIRFGIDPLIGLIPGLGDWLGACFSLYFLFKAVWLGGRSAVLGRMFINILIDLLIGAIPAAGELFDVYWKANERNREILRELEEDPEATSTESRIWVWMVFIQLVVLVAGLLWLIGWLITELLALLF